MKSNNSIKKNAVLNIIYTLSNLIFPLITFPYVSRVLSVDLMGKVTFFTTVTNYVTMLASLGISTYGIRAIAQARDDKKELSKTAEELFIINSVATAIVIFSLLVSIPLVQKFSTDKVLLLINCILIASTPFGMNWLFQGLEQYDYITKRSLVFKGTSLILVFAFVHEQKDYITYAMILVFSSAGSYIYNFLYSKKFIRLKNKNLNIKRHLKPILYLFASILAINIYTHLDTVMLGFINGDRQVGLYTVAVYVKTALLTMVNATSAVLLPRISFYFSNNDFNAFNKVLKKSTTVIMLLAIPLTIFFIAEARDVILILGGSEYTDAIPSMQIIMPILLISGFSNITGNQILIPLRKEKHFMKAVIVGSVMNLTFNALLMPQLGCVGAAIATLIAEVTQMTVQVKYAKDYLKGNINFTSIFKIALSSFVALGVMILAIGVTSNVFVIVRIMVMTMIFAFAYLVLLLLLKEKETLSLLKELKGKFTSLK